MLIIGIGASAVLIPAALFVRQPPQGSPATTVRGGPTGNVGMMCR